MEIITTLILILILLVVTIFGCLTVINDLNKKVVALEDDIRTTNDELEYMHLKHEFKVQELSTLKKQLSALSSEMNWRDRHQMGCF